MVNSVIKKLIKFTEIAILRVIKSPSQGIVSWLVCQLQKICELES